MEDGCSIGCWDFCDIADSSSRRRSGSLDSCWPIRTSCISKETRLLAVYTFCATNENLINEIRVEHSNVLVSLKLVS